MSHRIVAPLATRDTNEAICAGKWYVENTEYPPALASYRPLVNGQETFEAVHEAIANATRSIDIICWGFQPSMYFIRDGKAPCIGELLMTKASDGVRVRVLGWEAPFNAAGMGGETNLPGKGPWHIKQRELQRSTPEQYAIDRQWFSACTGFKPDAPSVPHFIGRGFDGHDMTEIMHQLRYKSVDPEISSGAMFTMSAMAPTHHQKTVLVDYELPGRAVGFVMGHNMLDEYWDTDEHSALNRDEISMPAPNAGPRGFKPRQDISSQVHGPILEHLHHNFAKAWQRATGEDLLTLRQAKVIGPQLQIPHGQPTQMAQILRTQAQEGVRDIKRGYEEALRKATRYIYIENQYFRWPPFAELIKTVADTLGEWGRDPGKHGPLHLFVITNADKDGIGPGTVKTQKMLESLGRANTIPGVTKGLRMKQAVREAPPKPVPEGPMDVRGQRELRDWERELQSRIDRIKEADLQPIELPNLKVHVCSLVAADSLPGKPWMPTYIHSKLMIIDDILTTHGSANINSRSMESDSELNILHDWMSVSGALRKRLWNMHTAGMGAQEDVGEAYVAWKDIVKENKRLQSSECIGVPSAPLVEFLYTGDKLTDID
ncbi:MAG: phospholipase [Pseudomonas sp.]|uniref:phospholipase n=1 Tax=Pseudomonas sp. TaxID=306 RepID=UPI003D6FB096